MTIQQILVIVRARYKLVLAFCLASVALVMLISLATPKQYTASVSLVTDVKLDPISGTVLPGMASLNYIANQIELIQSDRVAARAAKLLGAERARSAFETWGKDAKDKIPFDYYYGRLLLNKLQVVAPNGSNVIVLSFSGTDPEFSAAVANAFSQAYIETTIELRADPARQYAAWFDQRLKSLRGELESAQSRLSAYKQEKGIVASDERYDQELAGLTALSKNLTEIQSRNIEAGSHVSSTESELSPDVITNGVIQGIKADLFRAETKLSVVSRTAGINNPQRLELESQIDELKHQLDEETRRVSGSAAKAHRATARQEAELKALIAAQKRRVLALLPEHDEVAVLVKDVDTAQHAYEAVAQRMNQTNLESRSELPSVSILSPSIPPVEASRPRVGLNFLASLTGGLLLGVILSVLVELRDRRVRNVVNLAIGGIQLLGVLRPPVRPRALQVIRSAMRTPLLFKRMDPT